MKTVLVIDDDAALRDTIGLMLETEGFRPALAEDGRAGIKQAMALQPDLVLVDLRMPGLSGIEVCKQMRGAGMKTPLIVLSAIGRRNGQGAAARNRRRRLRGEAVRHARAAGAHPRAAAAVVHRRDRKCSPSATCRWISTRRVVTKKNEEMKLTRAEYNLLDVFPA